MMSARARLERHPDHPKADKLIDEEEDMLEFLREQSDRLSKAVLDGQEKPAMLPDCLQTGEEIKQQLTEIHQFPAHQSLMKEEDQCLELCRTWIDQQYAAFGG